MHKSTTASWVRASSAFTPAPELGRPPGGSSPVIHFFRDQESGARWVGKLGQVPLRDKEVIEAARRLPGFLGVYADEILEKLGLAVYQLLGTEVPESALSYQQVTMEAMHPDMLLAMQLNAEDEGRDFELPHSPRMHYLSRYVEEFQPLDKDFVEHYLANAKRCGNEYVKIQTRDGEMLPLRGLGSMLAAADFVYDLDCLGDACGNAGYLIREDRASGERYAQLVKIDAGYAFSYSDLRTDQRHNPRDRQIRVAPNQLRLQFADLAPADQREFAAAAKNILATPYEKFEHLFAQIGEIKEGIAIHYRQQLLDELIARKNLFLDAFAPETDLAIVKEIEVAQAKVAKKLERSEEVSARAIEELLADEKKEAIALAELRVKLTVIESREKELERVGKCKTFQFPRFTTHFVGREDALAGIAKQLSQTHSSVIGQSVSGIGGVGKTQLAFRYAKAAANGESIDGQILDYDYVVWLNADLFLEGQFQAMAEVWLNRYLNAEEAVVEVYNFLKGKRTLLIFDNLENACSLQSFLPPSSYNGNIHMLITSRSSQWAGIPTVKLGGFSLEEACEYVEHYLGEQSKDAVAKLLDLLDGLPLAMSQAVSYIKAGHCTLEDFREQFYLNRANLLSHELLLEEAHPKTVGTTLTLSLAQAKVQSKMAEQVLGIVAYLSAEGIKSDFIAQALEVHEDEVEQAVQVLASYSLLEGEGGGIRVHRLMQEVMRYRHQFLNEPHNYWNRVIHQLSNIIVYDKSDLDGMRLCRHAIAHVKQIANLSNRMELDQEQELRLCHLVESSGLHQWRMGSFEVARMLQERALEIKQRHYRPKDRDLAITLCNLGNVYGDIGDAGKEKELLERALAIEEEHFGKEHTQVAIMLVNLSNAYGDLGDAGKKKELLERALRIFEIHYGPNHVQVASVLTNLGNAYGDLGDNRKKRDLLERALRIFENHYADEYLEVAATLVNLGNAYRALGEAVKKVKDIQERALTIYERHYGPDHVKVVSVLVSLGHIYRDLEEMDTAKEFFKRALIISEQSYGSDHIQAANALVGLGGVYLVLGRASEAKNLLERALCIYEAQYGPKHPAIAKTLQSLSIIYSNMGNMIKQKELLKRALGIIESCYGHDHIEAADILESLGYVYNNSGKYSKAKELLMRALKISKAFYGEFHIEVASVAYNLACSCLALRHDVEGRRYAHMAYALFKMFGRDRVLIEEARELVERFKSNLRPEQSIQEILRNHRSRKNK